jgi:hypothetical protein
VPRIIDRVDENPPRVGRSTDTPVHVGWCSRNNPPGAIEIRILKRTANDGYRAPLDVRHDLRRDHGDVGSGQEQGVELGGSHRTTTDDDHAAGREVEECWKHATQKKKARDFHPGLSILLVLLGSL